MKIGTQFVSLWIVQYNLQIIQLDKLHSPLMHWLWGTSVDVPCHIPESMEKPAYCCVTCTNMFSAISSTLYCRTVLWLTVWFTFTQCSGVLWSDHIILSAIANGLLACTVDLLYYYDCALFGYERGNLLRHIAWVPSTMCWSLQPVELACIIAENKKCAIDLPDLCSATVIVINLTTLLVCRIFWVPGWQTKSITEQMQSTVASEGIRYMYACHGLMLQILWLDAFLQLRMHCMIESQYFTFLILELTLFTQLLCCSPLHSLPFISPNSLAHSSKKYQTLRCLTIVLWKCQVFWEVRSAVTSHGDHWTAQIF